MGKNDKSSLGRALVKHHNHKIQESKEKGQLYYKQHKKVLESVTDVADIDAVIQQADDAVRLFSVDNPAAVNTLIDLESGSSTSELTPHERRENQKKEEALHASSLNVPRRPAWNANMTVEELDSNERRAFLVWRRSLARLEENDSLVLTPFEKNLDIWRQLWRVLERSDLLVMVVDARDPLFYRCPDLEAYAREIDEHKRTLLLINKADLLPYSVRQKWADYFQLHGILYLFWSAKAATAELEGKQHVSSSQETVDEDTKIYGREELLSRLQSEAEEIARMRTDSQQNSTDVKTEHVTVGFVGYPNVGKSSTINALVGAKRTGVTSTPGKTKHFQTLIITEKLTLCDCPGLVFPSFTSSRYEMIASGVLPIHRMTEHREAVQVVADHVPRHVIEGVYNIKLPKPKPYEPENRPPFASELLRSYCASRGYVASSGLPDETKAARQILKDYIDGKLPHYELPPGMSDEEDGSRDAGGSDASESDESDSGEGTRLDDVMDDLKSFDVANGLGPGNVVRGARKKASSSASYKQHKKPQRKKDRAWRVKDDGSDGMSVVRVYQKAANVGSVMAK
ncbi:putative GTP binding domain, P-loop containing nucleoside triphosphate hydrolase [Helianthus annuus]|uniref:GTP binding domain, P-loop containing nucleoside triphosphate hydrolase n=1 Tax=Helianthus annuus TaxID=4232 RepID=A0A251SEM0_HELAN|nr:GTPase LSG1-2 [Helianthus annuus]KAF5767878.1 putative GTP binding domain, P-loop containing nucleoside triphosphate hydrolase [Helianthus annuus]KAJ0463317.1 putative GTP-binding protein, orthogonal bundle domain superfamily [Helianthus annuus]KAJ0467247.1 putative GTP binding domain, P-loop containing nucleoside triphosphate hydrolase, Ras GTPase GNL1 [Helianthus annuus]KAJ0484701.1 putative GTP-binding protein, orthogonal bundle domain superfamily [Helianthus annuus]KAJ0655258.1 putative